jgi:hypothetical protein
MIRGKEFQPILLKIFKDVKNYLEGEQVQVNCPVCQERDGLMGPDGKYNLEINTAKRVFRCWKCDEPKFSGSLGRLIRIYGTNADYEIYKDYAGQFFDYSTSDDEVEFDFVEIPKEIIYFSEMDETNPEHFAAYSYMLLDRKITKEQMITYRLGFCTEGKYEGRIIIPSFDVDGNVNYFVARSYRKETKPTYMNPKVDKDKIIFNEGIINWDSHVFIVEGVFDMFSLYNAIPQLGKTLSKKTFFKLKEKKPYVTILLDGDAWKNEMDIYHKLLAIYGEESNKILVVNLQGNLDIDEIRKKCGKEKILNILRGGRKLDTNDYIKRGIYAKTQYKHFH